MYKKRILGLAIASAVALTGCLENNEPPDQQNVNANQNTAGGGANLGGESVNDITYPIFNPATGALPIPNDLIFDSTASDNSFAVTDSSPPVTTALNGLSGASTVAPIDIAFNNLIDADSVQGNPTLPTTQNVFLLELEYASGSPVNGLSIGEIPNLVTVPADNYAVEVITLDGNSTIRINPKEPLKPRTRYVVAVMTEITTPDGRPIRQDPAVTGYSFITDETKPLLDAALAPVRSLTNALWEPTALGYINTVRGLSGDDALTDTSIAMSYSFTTSDDEKTLAYIADPSTWITDRVVDLVKETAAEAAITGGATDFATIQATVNAAFNAWLPSSLSAALAACDAFPGGQARFDCAGDGLFTALETGAFGTVINFPDPEATTITMNGAPLDVTVAVPTLAGSIPADTVWVDQGTMTIPYYSGLPTDFPATPTETTAAAGTGLPLKTASWEPDATLATSLNFAFYCAGLVLPQGNSAPALGSADGLDCSAGALAPADFAEFTTAPVSSVINFIYPFPAKQGDVTIPVMAIYPNPTAIGGATTLKTMIWGHGLTGNRSNSLGFGSLLVAQGVANAAGTAGASLNAVIAIDEPLHGLESTNLLNGAAFGATERHFGFQDGGSGAAPVLFEAGGSGSMFINLENFLATRDNNRQHAVDLMTLRESLPATALSGHSLTGNYFYSGHSLGTINSQAFVSVVNSTTATDDDITAAAFFTPGGGITRFFENSPTFAPSIIDGLAALSITPDTSSYQSYLNVLQASIDAFDAVNFAADFAGTTPMFYFIAANDLVIPVDQSSSERTLQTVTSLGNTVSGSVSFLSGAEPLATLAGATALSSTAGTQAITQAVARYQPCAATHGSPSIPDGSDVPTAAFANAAFGENLSHTLGLVISDGAAVEVTANAVSIFQDLPLPALILDESTGCP